jgi:hypothetical protein
VAGTEAGGNDESSRPVRYPAAALYPDYLRAACGLAAAFGPLLLLDLARPVAALLAGLGLLFAWFGVRTVVRHLSRVELSADAIALRGPAPRRLRWRDLERMKLAYYAPHRTRGEGWLQLTLSSAGGRPIRLDSTLSGFDRVLNEASRVARAKALALDPVTHANLAALGLERPAGGSEASSLSSPA